MTNEELRELDAWIAEHVMGYTELGTTGEVLSGLTYCGCMSGEPFCKRLVRKTVPHYSIDIAAAWEVVKALKENNKLSFNLSWSNSTDSLVASFIEKGGAIHYSDDKSDLYPPALAICLAAKESQNA